MSALAFTLQVLPALGLALIATFVGAAVPVGASMRIPLLLVGVLFFVGLMTFRRTRGWNLALLMGLAAVAGALISPGLGAGRRPPWTGAIALTMALTILAALAGKAMRGRLRKAGIALWVLAWIYLLGWIFGGLLDPPGWVRICWAGAGLIIFGGLVAVWFSQLGSEEIPPRGLAVAHGIDLYLLGLNIAVAGQVLLVSLINS